MKQKIKKLTLPEALNILKHNKLENLLVIYEDDQYIGKITKFADERQHTLPLPVQCEWYTKTSVASKKTIVYNEIHYCFSHQTNLDLTDLLAFSTIVEIESELSHVLKFKCSREFLDLIQKDQNLISELKNIGLELII
jgi:hypothetical protein